VLDCLPLKGESGVEPLRTFRRGGATGALKVAASPLGGSGGRKGAGCSVIAYIFKYKEIYINYISIPSQFVSFTKLNITFPWLLYFFSFNNLLETILVICFNFSMPISHCLPF
jgi:hypothetical protein